MKWLRSLFTPKNWVYFNYIENPTWFESDHNYYEYRVCMNTGLFQMSSIHCLGLNPPTYIQKWITLDSKPTFVFKNGVKMVKG